MTLTYCLVQCPVVPCDSWYPPGAPYKRHLTLAHGKCEYLNPNARMIVNSDGLNELDEAPSIGSDLAVRRSTLPVLITVNTI